MLVVTVDFTVSRMENPPVDTSRLAMFLDEASARARRHAPCLVDSTDEDVLTIARGIVADAAIQKLAISLKAGTEDPRVIGKQYPEFQVQYSKDPALYLSDQDISDLEKLCSTGSGRDVFSISPSYEA